AGGAIEVVEPNMACHSQATFDQAVQRARGCPVRFLTVGQGPLEAEIRAEHARLGLDGVVDLLGERTDAVRVMSACDAFVLASSNEGLPVAIMEALALGLPVVATDVGGLREAVDARDGILVPARDPEALADAIAALRADPARRAELAEGAAARAEEFAVQRTVDRLEAIYRDLADRRP
ncbi:MAG: glycosyltransferase, partial [Acidimicrobiia bacterium]